MLSIRKINIPADFSKHSGSLLRGGGHRRRRPDPPALIPKKTDLCRDERGGTTQFGRPRRVVERKPDTGAAARRIISPAASSTMIPLLSIIRWFHENPVKPSDASGDSLSLSPGCVLFHRLFFPPSDRVANPVEICSISLVQPASLNLVPIDGIACVASNGTTYSQAWKSVVYNNREAAYKRSRLKTRRWRRGERKELSAREGGKKSGRE